jgi:acetolactate synthase-1/2/3 large subunit
MPTAADLFVARLAAAGVRAIFGVPGGGGNLDLVAAAGRAGVPFVLTATETAAAIAAQAQADVAGTLGACLTTLGPGAASAVNGVACAWLERAPLVVFTDRQAGSSAVAFEHQDLDHHALFRGITKQSLRVTPATSAAVIDRAIQTATTGRPGPVHIDCPGPVLGHAVPARLIARSTRRQPPPAISASAIARVMRRLARARKPLAVVGLGARSAEAARRIDRLCRTRCVPAMVTYKAKGVVPDDHPWFAGVFTNAVIEQPLVREADLIIGIGLDPVELLPRAWPYRAPIIGGCPWPVARDHVPFAERVICDAGRWADIAQRGLQPSVWREADVAAAVTSQRHAISLSTDGLSAQDVVRLAADELAPSHRLTIDAGAHMFPATMLWPARQPHDVLISNGLSTMGYAVPAAIGASRAEPDRPVVAFTGDGGLLMCAGELLTIAREARPIIVVVFNDSSLSLIEIKQQARRLTPAGVGLGDVNWAQLAASCGLTAFVASTRVELADALSRARTANAPALVDVRIDRSNYAATLRAIRGT